VEQEILKEETDLDCLRDKLVKLLDLEERIEVPDNHVLEAMLDADVGDDEYEAEHLYQEKYRDDLRMTKLAINKVL